MRYAQIRSMDISNGENIGVALFVQGCHFHCKNCFNPETWDFNGGKEWTSKIEDEFFKLIDRPYIKRISILGGEPLCRQNCYTTWNLCKTIKQRFPNKKIWIYSGYTYEELLQSREQSKALLFADVLIDGCYIDTQRDITLKWRGSSNQRVIDLKATMASGKIVLWDNVM